MIPLSASKAMDDALSECRGALAAKAGVNLAMGDMDESERESTVRQLQGWIDQIEIMIGLLEDPDAP